MKRVSNKFTALALALTLALTLATACGSAATTASIPAGTSVSSAQSTAPASVPETTASATATPAPASATATPASATATPASADTASFTDLATDKFSLIALGNSDVPVGQYSEEILTTLGIWDKIQSKISFCGTVKEVLSQVSMGSVDCGIVYATDAATTDKVKVVATASADMMKTPVVYPAAVLKETKNSEAAQAFLNFLLTDDAKTAFIKAGFTYLADKKPGEFKTDADCTLNIFAAASLTESLTEIGDLFMAANPNVKVVFNFDSSGTLETQIESGAEADLFFSAAQKQMKALADGGYLMDGTKTDLLGNEVVLIVPAA